MSTTLFRAVDIFIFIFELLFIYLNMKENLKIAVDCDEVLRSTLASIVELYNKNFGQNLTRNDVKDFNVEVSFPEIRKNTNISATEWLFEEHSRDIFYSSKAFPGSDWALEELKKFGDVTILSYQDSYSNKRDTLDFLHREGLDTVNICFLNDKSRLECDILIDDNPEYFKNCKAKVCILITAPYNKDLNLKEILENCNCKKVLRFDTLFSFAKYFRQINGNII